MPNIELYPFQNMLSSCSRPFKLFGGAGVVVVVVVVVFVAGGGGGAVDVGTLDIVII